MATMSSCSGDQTVRVQIALFAAYLSLPLVTGAQSTPPAAPTPLTFDQKFRTYLKQGFSVPSVLFPAVIAGINQAKDSPKEWGQGSAAYGERVGALRGQLQLRNFCAFAVGAALREDPRFLASGLRGARPRMDYVLVHTLTARTDGGREQPAFGTFAGAFGSGFFPNLWLPPSQNTVGRGFMRAISLGVSMGTNMGIEFGPDVRRFFRIKVSRRLLRH
jgi:hypothetical protein